MKLARGVAKLSLSSIQASLQSSDNDEREIIKHIDYDMLERAYNIHKYYPQYIHNYDISTPVLRMLIVDKPIYNDANRHLKNGESYEKRKLLNCQLHEKRDARKASRKERKERKREKQLMKQEQKLKNKGYHDQFKNEDSDYYSDSTDVDIDVAQIITGKAELVSIPLAKDSTTWSENSNTRAESTRTISKNKLITKSHTHPTSKHNSFGFKILNKMFPKSPPGTKNSTDAPSSKMISLQPIDKSTKSEIIIPLQKANTFEQTKSNLTLTRRLAKRLTRSDQEDPNVIEIVTENVTNGHSGAIERIQYTQSQMVGHGSFGVVFQTQILPTNEIAAMKRVLQDKRFKNRELQIMKLVHHRNIADLKYYFYTNNDKNELYLNLILEFVPETLYKASHYYVSKRLSMPPLEVKLYTYQMFRALNYIHSQGICHRDIKPQNLLINPDTGELKLCDFGSAKILNPDEPNVSYICSRYYRAPELIFGATNYTTKIDVWSAGCVMAELILGQPLFPGESGIDQLVEIIKILGTPTKEQIRNMNPNYMEHKFPQIKPIPLTKIFKKIGNDCILFLIKVLQYSPVDRISSVEALVDVYFDELRNQQTKLPNYRKIFSQQFHNSNIANNPAIHSTAANYQLYNNQPDLKDLPALFDFNERELSVAPELNHKLVPQWAIQGLALQNGGIQDLNEFVPMNREDMRVTLE